MPAGYVTDSDNDADPVEGASDDDSEIPGAVQSANYRVYSTWELYERMNKKTIDVAPPYQRDVVWTKNSQSALIDSIFKNKWVPTLLFSERPACIGPDGTKIKARWVCMDGKQRLTSIKLFLDGEIPWYKKPKEPVYYKQSFPPHPSRILLNEQLKDLFLQRGLTAAMYNQLTELQERDIFRLVQEGKPLSTGEKLQASSGPWGSYIGELTGQYMINSPDKPNGWCQRISNLKRGADYHTIAQVVLMIRDIPLRAPEPPRNLTTAAIQKELDNLITTPVPQKIRDDVRHILDIFMEISTLAPSRTPYTIELKTPEALYAPIQNGRKTMLAPVEMIWIPYMIYLYHSQLTKAKLLEMIETFKIDIRKRWFNEVKNNGKVIPWILEWITTFDVSRLKGKYSGWAVPHPAPQLASEGNLVPKISGMHEFAKSLVAQTSITKNTHTPLTESDTHLVKRPRHSLPATSSQTNNSNLANAPPPQEISLPVVSSSLSHSETTRTTNWEASARARKLNISNSQPLTAVTNPMQVFASSSNHGREPGLLTLSNNRSDAQTSSLQQNSATAQPIPPYQSARPPADYQRATQPTRTYPSSSITQRPNSSRTTGPFLPVRYPTKFVDLGHRPI